MESDTGLGSSRNHTTELRPQDADEEGYSVSQRMELVMKTHMKKQVDSDILERKLLDKMADQNALRGFYEQKLVELQTTSTQLEAKYQKNIASSAESLLKYTKNIEAVSNAICARVQRSESDLKVQREQRAQLKQRHDILEQQLMSSARETTELQALQRELYILKDHNRSLEEANKLSELMWDSSEQLKGNVISTLQHQSSAMQIELTTAENRHQQAMSTLDEVIKRIGMLADEEIQLERSLLLMESEHTKGMAQINIRKVQCEKRISEDQLKIRSLKNSIRNQANFTKTIRDENIRMQQGIENMENEQKEVVKAKTEKNRQIEEFKNSIVKENAKNKTLFEETKQINLDMQKALQNVEDFKEKVQSLNDNIERLDAQINANKTMFSEKEAVLMSNIQILTETASTGISVEELDLELAHELEDIAKYKELQSENRKLYAAEKAQMSEEIEEVDADLTKKKQTMEEMTVELDRVLVEQEELKVVMENVKSELNENHHTLSSLKHQLAEEQMDVTAREKNIEKLQVTINTTNAQFAEQTKKLKALNSKEPEEQWAQRKRALLEEMDRLDIEAIDYDKTIKTKEIEVLAEYTKLCEEYTNKMSTLKTTLEELQPSIASQDTYNQRLEQDLTQERMYETNERLELDKLLFEKEVLEKQLREPQQNRNVASTSEKTPKSEKADAGKSGAVQKRILKPSEWRLKASGSTSLSQTKSVQFVVPPPLSARQSIFDFSSDSSDGSHAHPHTASVNLRRRRNSTPPLPPPSKRKFHQKLRSVGAAAGGSQPPRKRSAIRADLSPPAPTASLSQPIIVSRSSQAPSTREEEPTRDVDHAEQ